MAKKALIFLGTTPPIRTEYPPLTRKEQCRLNNALSKAETESDRNTITENFMEKIANAKSSRNSSNSVQTNIEKTTSPFLPQRLRQILKKDWVLVATHRNDSGAAELLILPSESIQGHNTQTKKPNSSDTLTHQTDDFEGFHRLTLVEGAQLEASIGISTDKRKQLCTALSSAYNNGGSHLMPTEKKCIPDDAPLQRSNSNNRYLKIG